MRALAIDVRGGTQLCKEQTEQSSVQNCWYIRKLNEVESHSGVIVKKLGSMNLEEFIKNAWTAEINQPTSMEGSDKGYSQGGLPLSRTASEKAVDEDFLEKTGTMDESSLDPVMPLDIATTSQCFAEQMGLSPAPSIGALSDTPILAPKRGTSDHPTRGVDKRLKRKIKNRESAARSRTRKQAYHNEFVSKVSCLEEKNLRLNKEKVSAILDGVFVFFD
ncbi:ABSCISIC ACID-INSENSITIVE 5-like protein 2 [Bienertia sinuspersici]